MLKFRSNEPQVDVSQWLDKAQHWLNQGDFANALMAFQGAVDCARISNDVSFGMQYLLAHALLGKVSANLELFATRDNVNKKEILRQKHAFNNQLSIVDNILQNLKSQEQSLRDGYNMRGYSELLQASVDILVQKNRCFYVACLKYADTATNPVAARLMAAGSACKYFEDLPLQTRNIFSSFYAAIATVYDNLSGMVEATQEIECIKSALTALDKMDVCDVSRKNYFLLALLYAYERTDDLNNLREIIQKYSLPNCAQFNAMLANQRLEILSYCFKVAKNDGDMAKQLTYVAQIRSCFAMLQSDIADWMVSLDKECEQLLAQPQSRSMNDNDTPVFVASTARLFRVPSGLRVLSEVACNELNTRKRLAAEPHYDANVGSKKMRISELCNAENEEWIINGGKASTGSISPQPRAYS